MMNFVSNNKNPYAPHSKDEKEEKRKEQFISNSKAGTIHMFRNNTANITGRKVTFKHV